MGVKSRIGSAILKSVKNSDWYANYLFQDCEKFWNMSEFNLDVVNLGSTSAVHAFDYSGLPIKGANWALSRNYLAGDRAVLQNYVSHLRPKGATVLIPLCLFSSLSGRYEYFDDRYYTILYPSSIPDFSKSRQIQVMDLKNNPVPHYPAFRLWLSFRKKLKGMFHRDKPRILSEIDMERNASMWIKDWMREFSLDDLSSPLSLVSKDAVDVAVKILDEIIAYCRDLGHNPVLVFPPMYHTLAEKFLKDARDLLVGSMVGSLKYKDVAYMNYMDDAEFFCAPELFENACLMNGAGAKRFTSRVLKDIGLI